MKLTIHWSTRYNGVWVEDNEGMEDDVYAVVETANEDMDLASVTYDMCAHLHCFDEPELSAEQVETLKQIVRDNKDLKKLFGEFEVGFEVDHISS